MPPLYPKAPSTHTSFACLLLPLLNFSSSARICPQITCPACMQWFFPLKTGAVPSSSPFRPSQGLTHLGGARGVLHHHACSFLTQHMGQAAPEQHCANNPGLSQQAGTHRSPPGASGKPPHCQHAALGLEGAKVAQPQLNSTSATVWTRAQCIAECKTFSCGLVSLCSLKMHQWK